MNDEQAEWALLIAVSVPSHRQRVKLKVTQVTPAPATLGITHADLPEVCYFFASRK